VSVPARRAQAQPVPTLAPTLAPAPAPSLAPAYAPAPKRDPKRGSTARRPAARSRRAPLRFWIFAAAVVSCLVIAVVGLDSLLVQTDYAIRNSQLKVTQLQADHDVLVNQVAQLSSPSRIAGWAKTQGMVEPIAAVILKIHGSPQATSGGEGG
jgi:cell division protein FtsL